jgi:anti-sigma B factor antagonist
MTPSDNFADGHSAFPLEMFEVRSVQVGDDLCVLVSGELDLASTDKLDEAIRVAEKSQAGPIVVDLTHVQFMDSAGLAMLMSAHTRSRQDGDRIKFMPSKYDAVRQLVAVTGSSRMFN